MKTITWSRRTSSFALLVWLPGWWAARTASRQPAAQQNAHADAHADARSAQALRSTVIDHPMACWRASFGPLI